MERNRHIIDATNQSLGRVASRVALLLRGKQKTGFVPHEDMGDFVIVTNIREVKITGKKLEQKKYYRHSGYLGSLKERRLGELFEKDPAEVFRKAVLRMLPATKLRAKQMKRLEIR